MLVEGNGSPSRVGTRPWTPIAAADTHQQKNAASRNARTPVFPAIEVLLLGRRPVAAGFAPSLRRPKLASTVSILGVPGRRETGHRPLLHAGSHPRDAPGQFRICLVSIAVHGTLHKVLHAQARQCWLGRQRAGTQQCPSGLGSTRKRGKACAFPLFSFSRSSLPATPSRTARRAACRVRGSPR